MKKFTTLASVLLLAFLIPAHASLITIAEWNFNFEESTDRVPGHEEVVEADVGDGLLFVVNGPTFGTNFARDTSGGTLVNASDGTAAGGRLGFDRRERWHNGVFDIRVNTTGLEDIHFSFAMDFSSDGPNDITVAWTVDEGDTLNTLETIEKDFGWTRFAYDLSGEQGVNNQENLWFRFTFASEGGGAASGGYAMRLDNVIVTAIPEPGTLVLLGIALGFLVHFSRRR